MKNDNKQNGDAKHLAAMKIRLANIKDELELYGWSAFAVERYMRDAKKALAIDKVVELFDEMLAEERAYYKLHVPLADDQLDHTELRT